MKARFALSSAYARESLAQYMAGAGYRAGTAAGRLAYVEHFFAFAREEGVEDLRNVDRACMLRFAARLNASRVARTGEALASRTKRSVWSATRLLFTVLHAQGRILAHPMRTLRFEPTGPVMPRITLSEDEVARFLDGIDERSYLGRRDTALFELIYSSALRASEASALVAGDLDCVQRLVRVRQGKCARDRVVPMTAHAAALLAPLVTRRASDRPVFVGEGRRVLSPGAINRRFKRLLARQGMEREGLSVHALRHACATHLLAHGADLRYVQTLLGHDSVETTVVYTNERLDHIRRRYLRAHPRENEYRLTVDDDYRARLAVLIERLRGSVANSTKRKGDIA